MATEWEEFGRGQEGLVGYIAMQHRQQFEQQLAIPPETQHVTGRWKPSSADVWIRKAPSTWHDAERHMRGERLRRTLVRSRLQIPASRSYWEIEAFCNLTGGQSVVAFKMATK